MIGARERAAFRFRRRWSSPGFWLDWLLINDPDLSRLRAGLRPAIAVALTTALLALYSHFTGVPLANLLVGIVIAMISTAQANEAPRADQPRIIAWLAVPGSLCLIGGTLLAPHPWLGQAGLVAVTFLAIFIRRDGQRGNAFGQIGFLGYFFALFFQAPLALLPSMVLAVCVGVTMAYASRFWLVREGDRLGLRWSVHVLPIAIGMLLATVADGLAAHRGWGRREEIALREARRRVNRIAITMEDHLKAGAAEAVAPGLTAAELRERIFELELALDVVGGRARVLANARDGDETPRLEAGVERPSGSPEDVTSRLAAVQALLATRHRLLGHPRDAAEAPPALSESLLALLDAAEAITRPGSPGRVPPAAAILPPTEAAPAPGMALSLRQAIQAAIAVGLSIVAGQALSPTRWTWAAIGAYIMFIRATTLGETLVRGWHRITGTLAGVGAGIVIASLVAGHEGLELTVVCLAIFAGFYLVKIYYAGLVFGITLVLSVLYTMLGSYSPGLLVLRIEETLVGCAIGGLVAALVLPAPTRAKVDVTLAQLLRELADLLREAAASELVRTPAVLERSRGVDRTMQALRDAAKPLSVGLFGLTLRDGGERVHLADRAVLCLRHLAGMLDAHPLDEATRRALAASFERVEGRAEAIAAAIEHPGGELPAPPARRPWKGPRDAFYWLDRLEDALSGIGEAVRGRHQA